MKPHSFLITRSVEEMQQQRAGDENGQEQGQGDADAGANHAPEQIALGGIPLNAAPALDLGIIYGGNDGKRCAQERHDAWHAEEKGAQGALDQFDLVHRRRIGGRCGHGVGAGATGGRAT